MVVLEFLSLGGAVLTMVLNFKTTQTGTTTTGISYISGSGLNINSDTVDSLITLNRTTGIWSIDNDSSYHLNFKATSLGTTNLTLKSTGEVVDSRLWIWK